MDARALCAHTTRAKITRSRRPFRFVLESGARGSFFLKSPLGGGPISLVANSCEALLRSLRLTQRIITGFVQALDFGAVEALIPDLKPCAEGFGCA
jgi:hypothetical protein